MDDRELLQEYGERQSEKAFAELVARHVRLVYATALRLTGERQAAEDVVQAVFLLLARKSWMVRDGNALPGWLYRATQRTAFNEMRKEQRRRQRETEVMNNAELDAGTQAMLTKLLPLLDEALGQLSPLEQNLIILRFFENKSLRETSEAAALSEAAAQKRLSRIVEKLRQYFARSGVTVASGAVETALIAPSSQAVPIGLAAKVTSAALAGSGAALGIGDAVLKFFFTMNTKTQVALAVVVVALIGLPFLRSANVPDNAPAVVRNSGVAQAASPAPVAQTAAPQIPTVAQAAEPTAAPEPAAASNPATPTVAQSGQPRQASAPTQPRVPLAAGSVIEPSASQSQLSDTFDRTPGAHPISHNMGVRLTGMLGLNNPVDATFVGNNVNNRIILYEPNNVVYPGKEPVLTVGTVETIVSPHNGGYQVNFSGQINYQRGVRGSNASGVAILQPGESTTASSDDGQVNLKATLIEIPTANSQAKAQSGVGQNLQLRIRGTAFAGYPFDIHLASAPPIPGILATGADEIHSIGTKIMDNGVVVPAQITTRFQIISPDNSGADPDSYDVQYLLNYTPPGTTVNAAGKTVPLFYQAGACNGRVLLKVGQTVTVQDVAGVGNIEISLSTADY